MLHPRRMSTETKHLIIGAGPLGLAFAKALKDATIPYDHVESDDDLGGNWYHGVYETAHIISSKRTTQFADFPMPADYPDFPSAQQMLAYLRDYASAFGLRDGIEYNSTVTSCRPVERNLWEVTLDSGEHRLYKGVIICIGHHWDSFIPIYPGTFNGEIIHSKAYKNPDQLRGRRVLVVGGGNSACDIASEAARVGAECHLSMRRGHWFLPKTLMGRPTVEFIHPWLPIAAQRLLLRTVVRLTMGDYQRYGLQRPDHRIFETHPTINSELLHYLSHGRITPHPAIERFEGDEVLFVDGTRVHVDLVVFATGYHVRFPFLPPGLVPVRGAVPQVYGGGTLPDYKGLYIVGSLQVRYGFGPLVTPYARLFADVIRLQDKLEWPVGRLLQATGERIPRTHLIDPIAALRKLRRGRRLLPLLLWVDRWHQKRHGHFQNSVIAGIEAVPQTLINT